MTYNLHHCLGDDGIYDVARIAQFMSDFKADIVLCQEVDREYSDRSQMHKQPEMLAEQLGYHMFYGPNIGETYGNMILSKYPIRLAENVVLPNQEDLEPRGLIVAKIDIGSTTVTFLDTHLSAFSKVNRGVQVEFLREYVASLEQPVIFGADFNTRPSTQLKPFLDDGVLISSRDTILGLGEGIDDLLVPSSMRANVLKGEIIENVLSDHPAYWIDIVIGK